MSNCNDNALWLTFVLDGMDYCILSDYIEAITIPDSLENIPHSAKTFAGITTYSKKVLGVVEMREVFGRINLQAYIKQFATMKDMHISWVEDLTRYVHQGGEFTKPVSPHQCQFGQWYDSFHTDNKRLGRLLKKINTPHERIHHCGAEIIALRAQEGDHEQEISDILAEADTICQEEIIPLLDRLIDIYRAINRGVLLVIRYDGRRVGFLVDEVRMLIPCKNTTYQDFTTQLSPSPFLEKMVIHDGKILFEVNVERILAQGLEQMD